MLFSVIFCKSPSKPPNFLARALGAREIGFIVCWEARQEEHVRKSVVVKGFENQLFAEVRRLISVLFSSIFP